MRSLLRKALPLLAVCICPVGEARAQFTADFQTNTINGVFSNYVTDYYVGRSNSSDVLIIKFAGTLMNSNGYVGYDLAASNNVARIEGPAFWRNTTNLSIGVFGPNNQMTTTLGAEIYNDQGTLGATASSFSNQVLINGALWTNRGPLIVGSGGARNRLTITNGGRVFSTVGFVGNGSASTNNAVLITGAGSMWSNSSTFQLNNGAFNSVTVSNGGRLVNQTTAIGAGTSGSNNTVSITGSNSVWRCGGGYIGFSSSGNRVMLTNGGDMTNEGLTIGYGASAAGNSIHVAGTGSVWNARIGFGGDVNVGWSGANNQLVIQDGGMVMNDFGRLGMDAAGSTNNMVLVTGSGSLWSNLLGITVGLTGSGNQVIISNHGTVLTPGIWVGDFNASASNNVVQVLSNGSLVSSDVAIGYSSSSNTLWVAGGMVVATNVVICASDTVSIVSNNLVRVDSGSLFVTNPAGTGTLVVSRTAGKGSLLLNGGAVTADSLIATNGANSVVTFNGGILHTKGTAVTNTQQFVVGDGATTANLHLVGGLHSFTDGVRIRNAAWLSGCGTVNGAILVDAGGNVSADCGPLIFNGAFTNNGTLRAINGGVLEFYGAVVNNGLIDTINGGAPIFHAGFVNNGTVVDASSVVAGSASISGGDVLLQIQSATGHNYQLQGANALTPPGWTNVGVSQAGTGGMLTFTNTGAASNQPGRFYHFLINAPGINP